MSELDKFNTEVQDVPTLEQFATRQEKTKAFNDQTISNRAAKIAVLKEDSDPVDTYVQVTSEMQEGTSGTAQKVIEDAEAVLKEKQHQYVSKRLGDVNLPEADKEALANNWIEHAGKEAGLNRMVAEKFAEADGAPDEKPEEEDLRVDMMKHFKEADEYRAIVQGHINSEALLNTNTSKSGLADMLEVMVPFVENKLIGGVIDGLRSEDKEVQRKSLLWLGDNKAELRDWFKKMPLDDRKRMIPKLVEVVRNSDTIVFDETNDLARNEFLRSIIDEGYYTDTDELIDNVVSVLDLIGIGATAKSVLKSGRAARAAIKTRKIKKEVAKKIEKAPKNPIEAKRQGVKLESTPPKKAPALEKLKDVEERVVADVAEHVEKTSVRSSVQPTATAPIVKDVNPHVARKMHAAASSDETGQIAKATYGTTRTEAIAGDLLPEIGHSKDTTMSKLSEPDALMASLDMVADKLDHLEDAKKYTNAERGAIEYFEKEKATARSKVVNDFQNVKGVTSRKEMFKWDRLDDGAMIKGVYGPQNSGYKSAKYARDVTRVALRNYGIAEDQITILKREGAVYEPVSGPVENLPKGDYLAQVDFRYKINPTDIVFDEATMPKMAGLVPRNVFDYMPQARSLDGAGSVQSHLLDAASMLDPQITKSASVAVDKAAKLSKMLGDATKDLEKGFRKLTPERRLHLTDLFKEANAKGFDIDDVIATARGLTVEEKALTDTWKGTWDTLWHLENDDLKKTLTQQGYKVYTGSEGSTLFVKPQPFKGKGARVYDPRIDSIRKVEPKELEQIYAKGGEVGKLKSPMKIDNESVGKVLSYNNTKGFIRALNESDQALNYRKGYYQVHYKDPFFIEEKVVLANGEVKWVAKGTARTQDEAEVMREGMATNTGNEYRARPDRNQTTLRGDSAWESMIASGRSSQRVRGKRLEDSIGGSGFESNHLIDPAEALSNSIQSISRRVEMRDWADATKGRFMSQYADVLPKDKKGRPQYPSSAKDILHSNIAETSGKSMKELRREAAEAATTWEYIRSMENGYTNHIDDFAKALFNSTADFIGGHNNPILNASEAFLRERGKGLGLSSLGRKAAFQLYLALNPLRQIVVQSHQMVQIAGLNPTYLLGGRMAQEATALTTMMNHFGTEGFKHSRWTDTRFTEALKRTGMTTAEAVEMYNDWEKSGMAHAVDTHNLVRSDWAYATSGDFVNKIGKLKDKFVEPFQKVGFDAGERANVMSAWLAFRHRAKMAGKDLKSPAVMDEVTAEARNFTYNMNKAGDMPYNSNALGLAMQFMQVPHKAFTQVLFNRTLTRTERTRMGLFNVAAYGTPALWIADNYFGDLLPEDPVAREAMVNGLETVILNKTFSAATGEDVDIDWSSLAPSDMHGIMDSVHMLFTSPMDAFFNAPAAQLVGKNGRVRQFFRSAGMMFGVVEDFNDPVSFARVAEDFARMSSGVSNGLKAAYAVKAAETLNSMGDKAYAVTKTEAILQAFGFKTLAEARSYQTSVKLSEQYKELESDVTLMYKEYKKHMAAQGKPQLYYRDVQRTFNEMYRVVGQNRATTKIIDKLLKMDLARGDHTFYKRVLEQWDWGDQGKLRDIVKDNQELSEDQKKDFLERLEVITNWKGPESD